MATATQPTALEFHRPAEPPISCRDERKLREALHAAQGEFTPVVKAKTGTAENGETYRYADLAAVLKMCLPILNRHGLMLSQPLVRRPDGKLMVTTEVEHYETGHKRVSGGLLLDEDSEPREFGELLSYWRRYDLCSLLAIVLEGEDTDAARVEPGSQLQPAAGEKQLQGVILECGDGKDVEGRAFRWLLLNNFEPRIYSYACFEQLQLNARVRVRVREFWPQGNQRQPQWWVSNCVVEEVPPPLGSEAEVQQAVELANSPAAREMAGVLSTVTSTDATRGLKMMSPEQQTPDKEAGETVEGILAKLYLLPEQRKAKALVKSALQNVDASLQLAMAKEIATMVTSIRPASELDLLPILQTAREMVEAEGLPPKIP